MEKVGILSEEINENLEHLRNRISDLESENENLKSLLNSKTHQLDKTIEILVKVHQKFQKVTQRSNIKNGHGSKMDISHELVRGQVDSKYPNFFDGSQNNPSEHLNGEHSTANNQSKGPVNGSSSINGLILNGFGSLNGNSSSSVNGTSADEIAEFAEVEEIVVSEDDSVSRNSKDDSFTEAVLNLGSCDQNNLNKSRDIIGNGCQITPVCDLPEIRPGAKYDIGYDEIDTESLNMSNGDEGPGLNQVTEAERLENCKNENGMYYCPECNYNTAEKQRFKRHFLVHTGEKPFKCNFPGCFKSFRYSSDYKIHMRGHDALRAHDAKVGVFIMQSASLCTIQSYILLLCTFETPLKGTTTTE